jgi:hypothetical protein
MVIRAGQKLSTGECIWADWGGFVRGWDALSCPENKKNSYYTLSSFEEFNLMSWMCLAIKIKM